MKLYRQVKAGERLPNEGGMYFVIGRRGEQFSDRWDSISETFYSTGIHHIMYWLEEIELPSEEEVKHKMESLTFDSVLRGGFRKGVYWLIEKLQ